MTPSSPVVTGLRDALNAAAQDLQTTAQALPRGMASDADSELLPLLVKPLLDQLEEVQREAQRWRAFSVRPPAP